MSTDTTTDKPTDRQDAAASREYRRRVDNEENPFADVVADLRDDGHTWQEIYEISTPKFGFFDLP